jgi:hypothetical protein
LGAQRPHEVERALELGRDRDEPDCGGGVGRRRRPCGRDAQPPRAMNAGMSRRQERAFEVDADDRRRRVGRSLRELLRRPREHVVGGADEGRQVARHAACQQRRLEAIERSMAIGYLDAGAAIDLQVHEAGSDQTAVVLVRHTWRRASAERRDCTVAHLDPS